MKPLPTILASTQTVPKEDVRTRLLPPFHVIIANDEDHSMEFVVGVLCKVVGCTVEHAFQLMMEAHNTGRAVVWTGSKEVAELKLEQILTFHETRDDGRKLGPLGCSIEPAPGA
jgi:ATP-dependent Clp protease adaptor protein ClpS